MANPRRKRLLPISIFIITLVSGIILVLNSPHLGFNVIQISNFYDNHRNKSFQTRIIRDFLQLHQEGKLPQIFMSLKKVHWHYESEDLEKIFAKDSSLFSEVESGKYDLEIEVFSYSEKKSKILVLQFNFFETESKNKVYEYSRSYQY